MYKMQLGRCSCTETDQCCRELGSRHKEIGALMGYNTVLFICNDMISCIDEDPEGWWNETKKHISRVGEHPKTYGFKSAANGFIVVTCFHSSTNVVVYAGGNTADFEFIPHGFWSVEDRLLNLRHLAGKLGYRLVKLPKTKIHQAWLEAKRSLPQMHNLFSQRLIAYLYENMR